MNLDQHFRDQLVRFFDQDEFLTAIEDASFEQTPVLSLDCQLLHTFDERSYQALVDQPSAVFALMDEVVTQLCNEKFPGSLPEDISISVRPFNLLPSESRSLRSVDPSDLDKFISLVGMVTRVSSVIPEPHSAFFQCSLCSFGVFIPISSNSHFEAPTSCQFCNRRHCLRIVHNLSKYVGKQVLKLQESPEQLVDGSIPTTITVFAYDTLLDQARPGDRVEIAGIYRAKSIRPQANKRTTRVVFTTFLEAVSIRKLDKRLTGQDFSILSLLESTDNPLVYSPEEVQLFNDISKRHDLIDYLVQSFAPSIFGNDDVKEGLLCQLVGGLSKDSKSVHSSRLRGEINILLVGDPGTAKSQFLDFVHRLSPRGLFTSGKGSSAVGLTAYVTRDPDTGEHVLESGALVLSDLGVCCIDEFDKMNEASRTILHEALEQQTISVAKAGIVCTLNARTSVLAAANPIQSRYNNQLSVVENINIPPTLLSRFDLIYLILDIPNKELDTQLAKHVVALYCPSVDEELVGNSSDLLPLPLLAKYIAYVRSNSNPQISDESAELLCNNYLDMRIAGNSRRTVTATPRQLESLIRIAEAYAKLRLSPFVEPRDVQRATELIQSAIKQSATDPNTGTIDLDKILTGKTAQERDFQSLIESEIRRFLSMQTSWKFVELYKTVAQSENLNLSLQLTQRQFENVLNTLVTGQHISWRSGVIKPLS
ncbi:hypothetical protein RCL1_001003 [Eukaryota sp. TZLM3-RCL]